MKWKRKDKRGAEQPLRTPIAEGTYDVIVESQYADTNVASVAFVTVDHDEARRQCRTIAYRSADNETTLTYARNDPDHPFVVRKNGVRTLFYVKWTGSQPAPLDDEALADLEQSAVDLRNVVSRLDGLRERRWSWSDVLTPLIESATGLQERLLSLREYAGDD